MDHEVIFKVKVTELGITRYDRKEWNVISKTGDYVNIGDPLVDVIFIRERSRDFVEVGRYTMTSDRDGYFVDSQFANSWDKEYSCYIFPTLEDLLEVHDKVYEITHDPYTSEIGIKWNSAYECGSKYLDRIQIDLSLFNGKPCLKFEYNKNTLNL